MVSLQKANGWLRAELHCHSKSSRINYFPWFYDSVQTVEDIIAKALELNIKILSITDHDSLIGYKRAKEFIEKYKIGIILVPGCEITTKNGHILAYGIEKEIRQKQSAKETIDQIHQQGGLAVAAHPFGPMGLGRMVYKVDIDGLEVGSLMTKRWNGKTVKTAEKFGKILIAGSDAHMVEAIGDGMTLFPPETKNWKEVLKFIKMGNISYETKKGRWLSSLKTHVKGNIQMIRNSRLGIIKD